MLPVKQYNFYKSKYGEELLIDVVELTEIKKYLKVNPVHTLSYYDITLVTSGKGYFKINDESYTVTEGDLIFSSPGQMRSWDKATIENGYALIFDKEFLDVFFRDPDFISQLHYFNPERTISKISLNNESAGSITGLILQIQKEIRSYQVKDEHILRAMLYQVLSLLKREYESHISVGLLQPEKSRNQHIQQFRELVESWFAINRSVSFYAGRLCITANYLNELVKKYTGESAKRYIQKRCLTEAKKHLQYSDLTITEIAYLLNFESCSYFIRTFKSFTGYTPQEYRQMKNRKK